MKLSDHFKIHPSWEHPIPADQILNEIAFAFTMNGFEGLYFKTKNPCDHYDIGMDCFQFQFDLDNGIYINDGDMKFNDFMGEQITDSGADVVGFINQYIKDKGLKLRW